MSTPRTETPRTGKYCPRCHAMTQREQTICGQCGHQFRTGTDAQAADAQSTAQGQSPAPDPLHRTMQFVLPPLAVRSPAPRPLVPDTAPLDTSALFSKAVLNSRRTVFAALAALALCLGAALFWHAPSRLVPKAASPVGVWETTLPGKASSNAYLEFAFQAGGTGQFSWRETGPAALSGQTPLRWKQNPDKTLSLALTAPTDGDPVSQTLTGIFSSHAWPWRVDRTQRQLILGTLVFTEKP